jgi:hypothetical protein
LQSKLKEFISPIIMLDGPTRLTLSHPLTHQRFQNNGYGIQIFGKTVSGYHTTSTYFPGWVLAQRENTARDAEIRR